MMMAPATHTPWLGDSASIKQSTLWKSVRLTKKLWLLSILFTSVVVVGFIALMLMPWQQTIQGLGEVSALYPSNRPQTIQSPLDARIEQWLVSEGTLVKQGQPLLKLAEYKQYYLDEHLLERTKGMLAANLAEQAVLQHQLGVFGNQASSYGQLQHFTLQETEAKLQQIRAKQREAEQDLQAAKQNLLTAKLNVERTQTLETEGLKSKRERELAELAYVKAQTDLQGMQAKLNGILQEQAGASASIQSKFAENETKVLDASSKQLKAQQDLAKLKSLQLKLEVEIRGLERRQAFRTVTAPVDGKLVRAGNAGLAEQVKEGQSLGVIFPQTDDVAAIVTVSDLDAPLVRVGRHARLQFSGFPALQFFGWPKVHLGTFAGTVSVVDAVDDGKNKFRVIITPDKSTIANDKTETPWPSTQYLRPGTQVQAWIQLDIVPFGYELWRRFNGFPNSVNTAPEDSQDLKVKKGFNIRSNVGKDK